jgi:hypothetical protein
MTLKKSEIIKSPCQISECHFFRFGHNSRKGKGKEMLGRGNIKLEIE